MPLIYFHARYHFDINVFKYWISAALKLVSKLTMIGSDNDLSSGRGQGTNVGIILIGPLGKKNFREIFIEIRIFSFKKMHLKHFVSALMC